ncbi:MAG: hypothetical protein JXA13_01845 [Anaerolineales bacterium]|nr:hypothetical protein [Anaerolineales bacterium]
MQKNIHESLSGRMIDPMLGTMTLECCRAGRLTFDYKGSMLSGPVQSRLTRYELEVVESL